MRHCRRLTKAINYSFILRQLGTMFLLRAPPLKTFFFFFHCYLHICNFLFADAHSHWLPLILDLINFVLVSSTNRDALTELKRQDDNLIPF